jgi:putative addiction module component (TIGR02574 family)
MEAIRRLPIEDRIELLGDAWDEIADAENVPVPEWHIQELDRRLADPHPEYISWDEVRRRLQEKRDD